MQKMLIGSFALGLSACSAQSSLPKSQEVTVSKVRPVKIDATTLLQAYSKDAVSANQTFSGASLILTGKVIDVMPLSDSVLVELSDTGGTDMINMTLLSSKAPAVGTMGTFRCARVAGDRSHVDVSDCTY